MAIRDYFKRLTEFRAVPTAPPVAQPSFDIVSYERASWGGAGTGFSRFNPDELVGQKGLGIYAKMRVDEQVKSVCVFVRDAIISRGWCFEFPKSSKLSETERADRIAVMEAILDKLPGALVDSLNVISTGREFGFSLTEKVYQTIEVNGKQWTGLKYLLGRDPTTFMFYTDAQGELVRCEQQASGQRVEIDLKKFVHYVHNPEFDRYFGRSDLREAHRAWYAKNEVIKLWLLGLEKLGGGMLVANVSQDAGITNGSAAMEALKRMVSNAKSGGGVVMPPGVTAEVLFPTTLEGFHQAIEWADLAIAKALLVPQMVSGGTQQQTGSYSQSQTQLESFAWRLKSDADRLMATLNDQLISDLGDLNWGDGDYPRFTFKPLSTEGIRWLVTTWAQLIGAKAVIPTEEDERRLREILEMPERDEKATPLAVAEQDLGITLSPQDQLAAKQANAPGNFERATFGDLPGHEFHGNQYVNDPYALADEALIKAQRHEEKVKDHVLRVRSEQALRQSERAAGVSLLTQSHPSTHVGAAEAHLRAAASHEKAASSHASSGSEDAATLHAAASQAHRRKAEWHSQQGQAKQKMSRASFEYDESQHPRDADGRWTDGGPMSGRETAAVDHYKANGHYHINDSLRKGATISSATRETTTHIDQAIDRSTLTKDVTLYRVINGKRAGDKYMKEGAIVEDKGFMSTSAKLSHAQTAVHNGAGTYTTLEIRAPKGAKALNVDDRAAPKGLVRPLPNESEFLLPRGTKLRVVSVDHASRHVVAEYVPHAAMASLQDATLALESARERVDFAVIERRQETAAEQTAGDVAALVAKGVQRLLGDDANLLHLANNPSDIADVQLSSVDVGRIKTTFQKALADSWAMGRSMAQNELRRVGKKVNNVRDAAHFADLRDKAAQFFDANAFRMAGNVSDGVRSLIQMELQNSVKFGRSPGQTREAIWSRLVSKGFSSREAVRTIIAGGPDDDGIEAALDALELESEEAAAVYLNTLARTNQFEAMNEARYAEFTDPALQGFVVAFRYSSVLDERTTAICEALHGKTWAANNQAVWNEYRPPNHYNCRSVLIPITVLDQQDGLWDGKDASPPTVQPQDGFGRGTK